MPFPTVAINNSTGSNTAASGAGPATAVTGSAAACAGSTSQRVGFNETTDLSTIATDGSAAIFLDAGGGITFMQITAVKDTEQTFTGDVNSTDGVVINVSSTAGLNVGDYINRPGAGANNLYIVSIDSATQITLNSTPGANITGDTLIDRRQVTVDRQPGAFSGQTWAIGGKRKDFETTNTRTKLLFTDAKAGWTIDIEETGSNYVLTSTITVSAVGNTTNGRLKIYSSSAISPTITSATNSIALFTCVSLAYVDFVNLKLTHTAATRGNGFVSNTGNGARIRWINCTFDGLSQAIASGTSTFLAILVSRCEIKNSTASTVATIVGAGTVMFSYIHDNAGDGISSSFTSWIVIGNIFDTNGRYAFVDHTGSGTPTGSHVIDRNVFYNNIDGIRMTTDISNNTITQIITNNIFYNNSGYGQNWTNLSVSEDSAFQIINNWNAYGSNTSGNRNNVSAGDNDVTLTANPFVDAPNGNFALNNSAGGGAACRAAGFPGTFPGGLTNSYLDIGAAQHQDSPSSSNITIIRKGGLATRF